MDFIRNFFDQLIVEWLQGSVLLELVDQYFTFQSDAEKVLMVVGLLALAGIGVLSVIRSVLKLASNALKIGLFIALAYYILVVVLGIDLWGEIFSNLSSIL
jgi:hypothetical protein